MFLVAQQNNVGFWLSNSVEIFWSPTSFNAQKIWVPQQIP